LDAGERNKNRDQESSGPKRQIGSIRIFSAHGARTGWCGRGEQSYAFLAYTSESP
jgi:hypothetical protein